MSLKITFKHSKTQELAVETDILVLTAFNKKDSSKKENDHSILMISHWPKYLQETFKALKQSSNYKGNLSEALSFTHPCGIKVLCWGLGDKSAVTFENLRKEMAKIFRSISADYNHANIDLDGFVIKSDLTKSAYSLTESLGLTDYGFDKYLTQKRKVSLKTIEFLTSAGNTKIALAETAANRAKAVYESINLARNWINEPPNILNSETYAEFVEKDAKNLKRVKTKVLNKAQIKKENMNLLLAVNAGSAFEPKVVHLTYTPQKVTAKTKHIALVGKGLTFDTGGYSLKPGTSMMGMKFDMAGSATVYAAFRAAVLLNAPVKVSCFLGITDNAVSSHAVMPDSIITSRGGKTVEILNTDAEGRLVLADVLDYACEQKPDVVIDAATLTGAMLVALGTEVCGMFTNNKKLSAELLKCAAQVPEYLWELPIVQEYRDDIKSLVADIKNIGSAGNAGSAKGAVFLEPFIKKGIAWAHLDIAGVAGDQGFLQYCPPKGASGVMVRTLVEYIMHAK